MVSPTFGTHIRDRRRLPLKIRDISLIAANVTPTMCHKEDVEKPQRSDNELSLFSPFTAEPEPDGSRGYASAGSGNRYPDCFECMRAHRKSRAFCHPSGYSQYLDYILGETVLERQSSFWKRKATLQFGSVKSPYERIVDLSPSWF